MLNLFKPHFKSFFAKNFTWIDTDTIIPELSKSKLANWLKRLAFEFITVRELPVIDKYHIFKHNPWE